MAIIVVGASKGGVGKSTIAVNICAWLAESGRSVCLFDGDTKQGSASKWARRRSKSDFKPKIDCVRGEGNI